MQKAKQIKPKLGQKAQVKFDKAVAAVYDGIVNVSRLRLMDKNTGSMSKSDWDCMYVERAFGVVISAISADIRGMMEVLTKQAQDDAAAITENITQNGDENKDVKEDNQQ